MRKKSGRIRKLNNSGSAMIVSIIVLLFVSILATVILYMAGVNYRMKRSELNTRISFYSAETTLENMQCNLVVPVSYALNTAYMTTNSQYLQLGTSDDRRMAFYQATYDALEEVLIKQYGGVNIGDSGEHLTDSTLIQNIMHNLSYDNVTKDPGTYVLISDGIPVTEVFCNNGSIAPLLDYTSNPIRFINELTDAGSIPDNFNETAHNYIIVYDNLPVSGGTAEQYYESVVELSVDDGHGNLLPPEKCRILIKNVGIVSCQNGYRTYVTTDLAIQFPPLDWNGGGSTTFEMDPSVSDVKWDVYQLFYYVNWQKS